MQRNTIDELEALDKAATPVPWHALHPSDSVCMSGITISTDAPESEFHEWDAEKTIAACLLQEPLLVMTDDRRWDANAQLIVAMRNALPELLRLARIGLQSAEQA